MGFLTDIVKDVKNATVEVVTAPLDLTKKVIEKTDEIVNDNEESE